jgi:SAM-dependent methyltransferase
MIAEAIRGLGLAPGSRVLDIGCGEGDTIARLTDEYGYVCAGIDKSGELIRLGRENHPRLDLRAGDAAQVGVIAPESFEAALIECVLSVSKDPAAILSGAARALKPDGYLLISDLCGRDEVHNIGGSTGRQGVGVASSRFLRVKFPSIVCGGLVLLYGLTEVLQGMGFSPISFEDRSRDLDSFVAEKIFEYGSLEAYYAGTVPDGSDPREFFPGNTSPCVTRGRAPGYFLYVCRKGR